jgi:multidrug transporter EmrE-like cation transporter
VLTYHLSGRLTRAHCIFLFCQSINNMTYLYFVLGISFNATASFVLKILSNQNASLISLTIFKNPFLYLAIFLFGMNVVFYALLLQKINLNIGYPTFVGGTFLIVLLLSFFILRESFTLPQILGIIFIFVGILLAIK